MNGHGVIIYYWLSAQVTCLGWKSEFKVTQSFRTFCLDLRKNDQQPNKINVCIKTRIIMIAKPVGQVMHNSLLRIAVKM